MLPVNFFSWHFSSNDFVVKIKIVKVIKMTIWRCHWVDWHNILIVKLTWEAGRSLIFRLFKSIFFLVEFYCRCSISNKILPYYVYCYCFLNSVVIAVGTFFSFTLYFFPFRLLSPYLISLFLCHLNLAVPMRECSGKHESMSSKFPKTTLNGAWFFEMIDE